MASPRLAPQIDGFEWPTLLGPTQHWPTPPTTFTNTDQQPIATEGCELCGEPVGDGRPFMTDTAGQTPVHIACSSGNESLALERQQVGIWFRLLLRFRHYSPSLTQDQQCAPHASPASHESVFELQTRS